MKDPRITKSAGAAYGEGEGEVFIANSNGLLKSHQVVGLLFRRFRRGRERGAEVLGRGILPPPVLRRPEKPEEVAAKAARNAYEMLDPRTGQDPESGRHLRSRRRRALLGGILAAVNGESVLQGASFLAKELGQKIASDLLTVIDDGTRPKGLASAPFDGEGVPDPEARHHREGRS